MTTKEALIATRALIEDPRRWTQGTSARNRWGHPVSPHSANACKWCVVGAFDHVTTLRINYSPAWSMLVEAAHHDLVDINDRGPRATAHAAIIALLDRAIAACD